METKTAYERMVVAPLPERTDSYTPIAHGLIDQKTREVLMEMNFKITATYYRSSTDGLVAQAEYHLEYGNDSEMGLMVAWQNSYNKAVSFKYAVGAHVFVCANGCVAGDLGAYRRKHTGSADHESLEIIKTYLLGAKRIFDKLVKDKEHLKQINLNQRKMAELMGRMFIEKELVTSTQLNIMKREFEKPTHDYGVPTCNAWNLYNLATYAFKEDNPKNWMKRHVDLHEFFHEQFKDVPTEEYIPMEIPYVETPSLHIEGPEKDFVMVEVPVEEDLILEEGNPFVEDEVLPIEPPSDVMDILDLF
jgi:hypothetical protein